MASPSCFSDAVIISACIQPVKAENRAGKRGGSVVRYAQTDKKEGVVLLYLGLLLLAGILQGVMVSLNGQMGNYFSLFGICFFVHAIALVLLLAYLLAKRQTLRFAGALAPTCSVHQLDEATMAMPITPTRYTYHGAPANRSVCRFRLPDSSSPPR